MLDCIIAGVVDTAEKFIGGVVETGDQFFGGVVDKGDKQDTESRAMGEDTEN